MMGAPWAQILRHWPQPMQYFSATWGLPALCCSILPARLPQPMPMFFSAPPKPASSWPLKWVREMNTSASITARPILAFCTYSPFRTGTSASSLPLRPSAMMIWQPVDKGENPLSMAASMWSRAFFRPPTYRVLQSVRKGLPPRSFTKSATVLAQLGRRKARLPGSPKCSLMAVNLPSKSIWPIPAVFISRVSF